jgi:hypothetical protein
LHQECKKRAEVTLDHLQRRKDDSMPKPKTRTAAQKAKTTVRRSA